MFRIILKNKNKRFNFNLLSNSDVEMEMYMSSFLTDLKNEEKVKKSKSLEEKKPKKEKKSKQPDDKVKRYLTIFYTKTIKHKPKYLSFI